MTYRIPQKGILKQVNKGDLFGNVFSSLNMDWRTNPGRIRVSPRLTPAVKDNDSSITNMGVPISFITHDISSTKQYFAACGVGEGLNTSGSGAIIRSDDDDFDSDWDNDGTASSPTTIHLGFSDMINWRDSLVVTSFTTGAADSKLHRLTSSWDNDYHGTVTYTFNVEGGIKNLCEGFNGNLYITDDDQLNYITPAGAGVQTGAGRIDFNGQYRPIWVRSSSNRIWIGLMSFDANVGSKGFVAEWSGSGTAAEFIYDIDAPSALSCTILDDIPYIIDAFGRLKKFRGSGVGFTEVARLPVANTNIEMPGIYNDLTNARWIHHRGMDVVNGKINIAVNNLISTGVYVENMPSGVWEYDPEIGLYHKNSPCTASTDFGQQMVSKAGGLFGTKRTEGNYLVGFGYYTDNVTTERKAVFYDDVQTNSSKIGQITTPFLNSEELDETWQKVVYRHFPLPSGDKIIGKYRTKKSSTYPLLLGITWTGTSNFTVTTDVSGAVGYEVEVVMGTGASKTSHITAVVDQGGGVYEVTVDETYTGATGTGKAYIRNFNKMSTLDQTDMESGQMLIGEAKTKVQIKTELRATGDMEIDDITVVHSIHRKLQ